MNNNEGWSSLSLSLYLCVCVQKQGASNLCVWEKESVEAFYDNGKDARHDYNHSSLCNFFLFYAPDQTFLSFFKYDIYWTRTVQFRTRRRGQLLIIFEWRLLLFALYGDARNGKQFLLFIPFEHFSLCSASTLSRRLLAVTKRLAAARHVTNCSFSEKKVSCSEIPSICQWVVDNKTTTKFSSRHRYLNLDGGRRTSVFQGSTVGTVAALWDYWRAALLWARWRCVFMAKI